MPQAGYDIRKGWVIVFTGHGSDMTAVCRRVVGLSEGRDNVGILVVRRQ